jgi:predicted nucleotidyltransferase component of viral defense system
MIPQAFITEWRSVVPWNSNEQIEQDLVVSRSLVAIFDDEMLSTKLAFRGGTALHKLYLAPQPRYSEDIDLVQREPGPIGEIIDRLRNVLSFIGKANVNIGDSLATMKFRFDSEIAPVSKMKLKVETNSREHFTVRGYVKKDFSVASQWFSGTTGITTFALDEILATKLRALYQRSKGRDLFDLQKALTSANLSPDEIVRCYKAYMKFSVMHTPTKGEYRENLLLKIKDPEFLGDTAGLLRPDEKYDPSAAYDMVMSVLVERM